MPNCLHLAILASVVIPAFASAQTFATLYTFPPNGKAGLKPYGTLLVKGNDLYGTTTSGGASNQGTVFKLNAITGAEKVLYSFAGGADGSVPLSGVIDLSQSLWGTTTFGGTAGKGTVFKLDLQTGTETVVYSFLGGNDGANPQCALLSAGGALYGTTQSGGVNGRGTAFKIDPATGTETVVYSFGGDAETPTAGLTYYRDKLYGVATGSAKKRYSGAAFAIDPDTGVATILHVFGQNGDGAVPSGQLLLDGGEFYGTTISGGANGRGTVFKLEPSTGKEAVLHSFQGKDGSYPYFGVVSQGGLLYGTTFRGNGQAKFGIVFQLDPSTGNEKVLHAFTNGSDGAWPSSALVVSGGNFFGITEGKDSKKGNTVFQLTP